MLNLFKKKKSNHSSIVHKVEEKIVYREDTAKVSALESRLHILEEENEKLKSALQNIQSGLSQAVSRSQKAVTEFKSNEHNVEIVLSEVATIEQGTGHLNQVVEETREVVKEVNTNTESVLELIQNIESIATQSKLLSFNASVEAARAGEAGKGFAVVAMEVQKMSVQTSELLAQIKKGMERITGSSDRLNHSVDRSHEASSKISSTLINFKEVLVELLNRNSASLEDVYYTNDQIFMSLAKIDHVIWKINTYLSVIHGSAVFDFVDHKNCRLGKWYIGGDGHKNFSNVRGYSSLDLPHCKVHNSTKSILSLLEASSGINYEMLTEEARQMEIASQEVFSILDEILENKPRQH